VWSWIASLPFSLQTAILANKVVVMVDYVLSQFGPGWLFCTTLDTNWCMTLVTKPFVIHAFTYCVDQVAL